MSKQTRVIDDVIDDIHIRIFNQYSYADVCIGHWPAGMDAEQDFYDRADALKVHLKNVYHVEYSYERASTAFHNRSSY